MLLKQKKRKKTPFIKNTIFIVGMIFKIAPGRIICELLNSLARYGMSFFYSVVFWKFILGDGTEKNFKECAIFIVIVLICDLAFNFWLTWYNTARAPISDIRIHMKLNKMLFEKAANVDLACYESPEFYEKYTKATAEAATRGISAVKNLTNFIITLIFCTAAVWMMVEITPLCLPFVLLPLVGHFLISPLGVRSRFNIREESTKSRRAYEYVNRTVYLQKYAGEMRMTGIFGVMRRTYEESFKQIMETIIKYESVQIFVGWSGCLLAYVFNFFGMWLLASYLALGSKTINAADFIVLAAAISSASNLLGSMGSEYRNSVEDSIFVESLREFLAYEPKIPEDQQGLHVELPVKTIEFKNVSFKYDGAEKYALKNINITLRSGTKTAVVGINGAGKSTFIKLLMRLYDPTEGEILLNGINIKEYNLHEYRMLIGATFQDFALFASSVLENVTLCEIEDEKMRKAAIDALKESGVYDRICDLKEGADTILTREFDNEGAMLSGGEGQKVAIARAFAGENPIIILDEPSSALDPIAEFNMYETILKLCDRLDPEKGKISVIISHRLSAAALSDEIVVLNGGELCEYGTHKELMALGGVYADLFNKQAESYLATESEVAANA